MNYLERLRASYEKNQTLVCLGLDPVLEDIPLSGDPKSVIIAFYEEILNKMVQKHVYPSAVKPNYAFYSQYGFGGIEALSLIIALFKKVGLPVILDVKRGDIDKTASAYAREAFNVFQADAVTLAPYMGFDSVRPFIQQYPDRGYYILTKTSNKSSVDFQDILVKDEPLFVHVAKKIIEWYHPGIGSVVGATYPEQLFLIADLFSRSGKDIPLLIPGIGTQGGSISDVMTILKKHGDIRIHRINSSSGINYAYRKYTNLHFAEAAVTALKELTDSINEFL